MTTIERTVYPRFKQILSAKDLTEVYTPTPAEHLVAHRSTKGWVAEVGFLVLLKTYGPDASTCFLKAMVEAGKTKEDLADLINVALDELTKNRFELPPFALLDKAAHHVRAVTIRGLYRHMYQGAIPEDARVSLDALFMVQPGQQLSPWELLKQEPASPTLTHMRLLIDHLFAISEQRKLLPGHIFGGIAEGKVKQFATEARALDATEMKDLDPYKRLTLAAAFLLMQSAGALDDLAEMFIKRMLAIHQKGKDVLELYRAKHQSRTDALVLTLRDLVWPIKKRGPLMSAWRRWIRSLAARRARSCSRVKNTWPTWAITINSFSGPSTKIIVHNSSVSFR